MAWALGGLHSLPPAGLAGPSGHRGQDSARGLGLPLWDPRERPTQLRVAGHCVCCLVTPHRQDTALGKSGTKEPPLFSLSFVEETPRSSAELCFVSSGSP